MPTAEVALIDRSGFPRDKPCADLLGPDSLRILDGLGMTGDLDISPSGSLTRATLDARLLDAAAAAEVEIRTGTEFSGFADRPSGALVASLRGLSEATSYTREFDLVVGADGAYSTVRKAMGIPHPEKSKTHLAIRGYARHTGEGPAPCLPLDWCDAARPGHGWVVPLDGDTVNVGVFISIPGLRRRRALIPTVLDAYHQDLVERGYEITAPTQVRSQQVPTAVSRQRLTDPHLPAVLLGDAGAMANPLTGEGIFYGLSAGVLLADVVALDSATADFQPSRTVQKFEALFRERFDGHYRRCMRAARVMQARWGGGIATRALAKSPRLRERALATPTADGSNS